MIRAKLALRYFVCRVLHSLTIISHPFRFVKGFFKSFFKFFSKTFFNHFPAGAEVPEYYITFSCVCQEVFQKFF